ncbi:xanthine dehydrogenase family protein subunit M [Siccirubricoccus sp. G192]|uniref:FAD binding domain-containing protein n=1 Tax=Siccirubricoccus sp. G192 TaxID=2849651 RepID=UPI001C2B9E93|nr:FAD binding domain-containing protein [Siccirubricoccus sp. G192]MBV1798871.1 FAD binding domain-containing protein [Siccirubricoccus sp. G192]
MKPAPFDYLRAETLEEALEALHQAGTEARVLAGGQSLLPMLNMRLARPALLVDIMPIAALREVADAAGALRIGAGIRQAALQARPGLARQQPLLAAALPWVGHAQTRSRGTLCGSVAHADPSAEIPLVLVAMGGHVHLRSRRGARRVAAEEFFTGMMATTRAEEEMIEAITLPHAAPDSGHAFREVGRRHGDFAITACAAVVDARSARLAVGGVADRPVARALPLPSDPALEDALEQFAWSLEARDDLHATAAYRRHLVRRLGRAVLEEAAACRA